MFKDYPETLDLQDKYGSHKRYDLNSLIKNKGNIRSGAYTALWLKRDTWVKFDNSSHEIIKDYTASNNEAYILFYKRVKNN